MSNGYGSFQVTTNIYIPFDEDQERIRITELFRDHAGAINKREVGNYDTQVSNTGQQWPSVSNDNTQRRQTTLRKLVNVVIDNSASPQPFPHGIDTKGVIFTKISGVIGNKLDSFLPIPFPGADQVLLQLDDHDVIITTSSTTFDGFEGSIILEYIPSLV